MFQTRGKETKMDGYVKTDHAKNHIKRILNEVKNLSCDLFKNPFFLAMSAVFIFGKLTVNLYMGAKIATALRSGIVGLILYLLGCYFIRIFTVHNESEQSLSAKKLYVLIGWGIVTISILLLEVQINTGAIDGKILLWGELNANWKALINGIVQRYEWIEGTGLVGWPYLILYVLFPLLLALCYRMKLPRIIGWKKAHAALPFVLLYIIGFVVIKGISVKSITTLLAVTVWPAFGEEFLYRGILQQALLGIVKKPVTAIVLTSALFAASHIPIYVFAAPGPVLLGWSALLPIMLTSFFWGYGYYRTGVLWPWILIHAISNLVGM
jgi:membrane protease YdiL (CAAX protease family)